MVNHLTFPEIDVRVDLHADPVGELRRLLDEFMRYRAYYEQQRLDPASCMAEEDFVAAL